jgi:carbon-monoxide dehydrogenase large subunit
VSEELRPAPGGTHSPVGRSETRREDRRLLVGAGRFVDDVDRPDQLWMRVVRSSVAHARLASIDVRGARALPGVELAATAADLGEVPSIPVRTGAEGDLDPFLQPVLATERARYVGEPVAVVLAADAYVAEDAAELVEVSYEDLPEVVDARAALAADAPTLREGHGNEAATLQMGFGDAEEAFAASARRVSVELRVGRHSGVPLEARGLVAEPDVGERCLTIWGATKVSHFNRKLLARLLGLPLRRIHMRSSDAGGGFGVRGEFYPEDFLVPYLARLTGRPVKWIEDRAEHLVATNHSREQVHHIEGAFAADGRLLALRDELWHDNGAYIRTHGVIVAELSLAMLPGPYRVPAYEARAHVVLTNKTPCGTYRGPGRFESTFARERLLDRAAHELGMDPVELRRINLLSPEELPHERRLSTLGTEVVLDAGRYGELLDQALGASRYAEWTREAERLRSEGRHVGTGLAYFLEKSGLGPYETAGVEVDTNGSVRVLSGGASLGQGIETVLAQIVASQLGVAPTDVEVVHGDTDLVPDGVGSWASRSTVVGGNAALLAARATAEMARRRASMLLETSVEDLQLRQGRVAVVGSPERSVSLGELADGMSAPTADGEESGLAARRTFRVQEMTYPYGVHLAQVEVDPETGGVEVRRYFIAYEVGRAVNPMLVRGQLVGGAAQGVGGALFEEFRYDDSGQPLCATFIDYLMPTAHETPDMDVLIREDAPSPGNPLGVKGAGEGGAVAAGAALASAVDDALRRPGAVVATPMRPETVHALARAPRE